MSAGERIRRRISSLEHFIKDPGKGLPEDVFLLVSRLTPLINVDLLIKNKRGQTLLTWRDDGFFPAGWHIPGGIVRYKETMAERIQAVARSEVRAKVKCAHTPLVIREVIIPSFTDRAHAISFLFACELTGSPAKKLKFVKGAPEPGQWAWHDRPPKDLIIVHRMYRNFI
ncbi:MAG: NUDIX domain-containing protein [Candidatus Omnitrophota bacterium]